MGRTRTAGRPCPRACALRRKAVAPALSPLACVARACIRACDDLRLGCVALFLYVPLAVYIAPSVRMCVAQRVHTYDRGACARRIDATRARRAPRPPGAACRLSPRHPNPRSELFYVERNGGRDNIILFLILRLRAWWRTFLGGGRASLLAALCFTAVRKAVTRLRALVSRRAYRGYVLSFSVPVPFGWSAVVCLAPTLAH